MIIGEDSFEIVFVDAWGIYNKDADPFVLQLLQRKAVRLKSLDRNWEKSRLAHPDDLVFYIGLEVSKRFGIDCWRIKPHFEQIVI